MRNYFLMLRILIPEMLGSMTDTGSKLGKKKKNKVTAFSDKPWLALVLSYTLIALYSVYYGWTSSQQLLSSGIEDHFISSIALIIPILAITFGLLQGISSLYHESKVDFFLTLPIKPASIIAAKLTEVFAYVFVMIGSFIIPALITHGIVVGRSWGFYLLILPFTLICSIAPFAIILIPVFILMRFTRFARNKDRFQMVSNIIFIAFIIIFAIFMGKSASDNSLGINDNGMLVPVNAFSSGLHFLPASYFGDLMLRHSDTIQALLYLLLSIIFTGICTALMLLVGNRLYIPGVLGSKGSSPVHILTEKEFTKALKERSQLKALLQNEWRLLMRTPVFFLQTVLSALIMPITTLLGLVVGAASYPGGMLGFFSIFSFYFQTSDWWQKDLWIITMVLSAATIFLARFNLSSSTAISRQGQTFQSNKLLPVPPYKHLIAWVFPGIIVSSSIWLILMLTLGTLLHISPALFFYALLLGLINGYLVQMAGICLDMKYPTLNWSAETQAVKNTKSSTIDLFGSIALAGLVIGLGFLTNRMSKGNSLINSIVLLLLSLGLSMFFTWLAQKMARKLFERIEL